MDGVFRGNRTDCWFAKRLKHFEVSTNFSEHHFRRRNGRGDQKTFDEIITADEFPELFVSVPACRRAAGCGEA